MAAADVNLLMHAVELNGFEAHDHDEPEFLEIDMTLDTGAVNCVLSREDVPMHEITPSEGSLAGQVFQAAGGKLLPNEGEVHLNLVAPAEGEQVTEILTTFQVAKVTRPLLSVTKICDQGELDVLCRKNAAYILDKDMRVVAKFQRRGGLYIARMRMRNPKYPGFAGQGNP